MFNREICNDGTLLYNQKKKLFRKRKKTLSSFSGQYCTVQQHLPYFFIISVKLNLKLSQTYKIIQHNRLTARVTHVCFVTILKMQRLIERSVSDFFFFYTLLNLCMMYNLVAG